MLTVPHFGHTPQVSTVVIQLLTLVHDGHLWLEGKIPINGELIFRITRLPPQGPNLATEFPGKSEDKIVVEGIRSRFGLVKGKRGFQVAFIKYPHVRFAAEILACKIMRK